MFFRLRQKSLNQTPAPSITLARRVDSNRTNLCQMHAIEVESAASNNSSVMLQHDKIAHVLADLGQRARQQSAVAGVSRDESVNLLRIGQDRFTRAHGSPHRARKLTSSLSWICPCACFRTRNAYATPHPAP